MGYQTWIPGHLRATGLVVTEEPGWESRGSVNLGPKAVVCHHTGVVPDVTTLLRDGRADLSGPLCNVELRRSGECRVIAAGRANHAGVGGYRGLTGNSTVLGIEASSDGRSWTTEQRRVYPILCAALAEGIGVGREWIIRHEDWAPSRKWDAGAWRTEDLRTAQPEEDDMFGPDEEVILRDAYNHATQARDTANRVEGKVDRLLAALDDPGEDLRIEVDKLRRGVRALIEHADITVEGGP